LAPDTRGQNQEVDALGPDAEGRNLEVNALGSKAGGGKHEARMQEFLSQDMQML